MSASVQNFANQGEEIHGLLSKLAAQGSQRDGRQPLVSELADDDSDSNDAEDQTQGKSQVEEALDEKEEARKLRQKKREEKRALQQRMKLQTQQLYQATKRYSLLVLKASAGLTKLLLEDVLNVLTQLAFAVRFWDELTQQMKAFTLASVGASLAVSTAGPVQELWKVWKLRRSALEAGLDAKQLTVNYEQYLPEDKKKSKHAHDPAAQGLEEEVRRLESRSKGKGKGSTARESEGQVVTAEIEDITILDFLKNTSKRHSLTAHRALVFCALLYWVGMASIPFLFNSSIKGGIAANIPASTVLYFGLITQAGLFAELWIANHSLRGYLLLRDCMETVVGACSDPAKAQCLAGIALSLLARYDTFSDVMFTTVLLKTEPITELKFTHTLGWTLPLPCPLHWVAVFALVVGVFLAQGLVGIVLLATKRHLAAAIKLNEFCFLLGLLELESNDDGLTASAPATSQVTVRAADFW